MVLVEQTCITHKHLSVCDYLHDGREGENKQVQANQAECVSMFLVCLLP